MTMPNLRRTVLTAAAIASFVGGFALTPGPALAATSTGDVDGPKQRADFADLVDHAGQAVVRIEISRQAAMGQTQEDFMRRFPMPPGGDDNPSLSGSASGFIIAADGYILTNAHVVDSATEVTVILTDKREFKATIVGTDSRTDIALLKIDAMDLQTVKIGDVNKARVGEWVAAIGAPFGLDNTVTAGILSAKSRAINADGFVPFLQSDVAVNPGNSGGPLFNMNGEVIGVNSQIYSRTGGYMGLSFAVPIDLAMQVKDQLQQHGRVTRARIGVSVQRVTKEMAQSIGADKARGALVSKVEEGGPADKAGLREGDVITRVNDRSINESVDLARIIGGMPPGTHVKVQLLRNGTSQELAVVLSELGDSPVTSDALGNAKLGVVMRKLTAEEQQRIGEKGGLLVEQSSGAAARAGIHPGDVILAVNREPVADQEELNRYIEKSSNVALLVERQGVRLYISVDMS